MKSRTCLHVALSVVFGIILSTHPARCQRPGTGQPGGGGTGAGGGTGTGTGRPTTPPANTTTNPTNDRTPNPFDLQNRPIFLSGKVMMDDGTPPPEPVVIERVCNSVVRGEAYTDSKGRFSFQLGQNTGMIQDASSSSALDSGTRVGGTSLGDTGRPLQTGRNPSDQRLPLSNNDVIGCDIRASLPGFRSDLVNLSGRRTFDNPDLGTIVLHRLGNVEGTTISATSLRAPKDARKAFEKGTDALRKSKIADAQKNLEKAVELYPQYASAWYELGRINEAQKDVAQARAYYSQALAADPKFVKPYLRMALLSAAENNWREVVDQTIRVMKLDSVDFPEAYYYNSVANLRLGKIDAAEASARQAEKLDTEHRIPQVQHVLGAILYDKKDYAGAGERLRDFLKYAPADGDADKVKRQLEELDRLIAGAHATAESPK